MMEKGHKIRRDNPDLLIALTYGEVFGMAAILIVMAFFGLVSSPTFSGMMTGLIIFSIMCLFWKLVDWTCEKLGWN